MGVNLSVTPPRLAQTMRDSALSFGTVWQPQPGPQTALMTCPIQEVFYGGGRGGGKTDGILGKWMQHADLYGVAARGIIFRRRFKQLADILTRCQALFPRIGARYLKGDGVWLFPNGATLRLSHLWDEQSAEEYQGHQYSFMAFEEAGNWPTPDAIFKTTGALRSAAGVPVQMLLTGNPGGAGHNWLKERYYSPAPRGYTPIKDWKTGKYRVFIPSRLEDNLALRLNDPDYEFRLLAAGSDALVKAWREGDWNVVAGGFFDGIFNQRKHIIRPFKPPATWTYRRSFDWGYSAPSSLGLWAISDGGPIRELDGFAFPRGSLIRIGEWYTVGMNGDGTIRPNHGLKITNTALGRGIAERSKGRLWSGCVADPSIFSKPGRDSIYDDMCKGANEIGARLSFAPANNDRISGWQRMSDMMEAVLDAVPERPGLWAFDTCTHYIRTIPALQRADKNLDDIDTEQEDHCADECRYACVSGGRSLRIASMSH